MPIRPTRKAPGQREPHSIHGRRAGNAGSMNLGPQPYPPAQGPAEVGPDKAFSTRIDASFPAIVERSTSFPSGGHATVGIP
jgi:hypothetical protein